MPIALAGAAIVGGIMSAHAAGHAADAQAGAAQSAAQLNFKASEDALAFQKQVYNQNRSDQAPWLQAGTSAIKSLSGMLKDGTFKDWTGSFQAPTSVTEQNDPGYQFRLAEGQKAIDRSAAARGGVLSGGTAKAQQQFGQDYASNEYSNVYNRSFNEYATKYNEFNNNQTNKYNRYAGVAGLGQQSANQLGILGQNSANSIGGLLMSSANQQGNYLMQGAAARASGYLGSANAYSGIFNNLASIPLLYQQQNNNG